MMNTLALKNGLNRYFLDGDSGLFTKEVIGTLAGNDWSAITVQLEEWQRRGLLRIVKQPDEAKKDDICIEMLNLIDRESPIPGWPSKRVEA
jgi:hypothetical protein